MGVKDFTTLIKSDDRFLIRKYRLHNVSIVIDANNLAKDLLERNRTDRVGVNLVAYGKQTELFFDNLRKCKIEPILVFDGAQTSDAITSTTPKKTARIKERFRVVKKLSSGNQSSSQVHPACANMILKSIAIEKQVQVVQCFYEADKHVAKIAIDHDSYVLSSDSDLFIFDIRRGVILTKSLNFTNIKWRKSDQRYGGEIQPIFYIECDLFNQSHFLSAFPGLDKSCLPLFASIAGNDSAGKKFHFLLNRVSHFTVKHEKLRELLDFLCNKSLEQSIDSLIALAREDSREDLRPNIKEIIKFYDLPEDDFDEEVSKHYKEAFCKTYSGKFDHDPVKANDAAEKEMQLLSHWLRKKIETSNLTKTCLELALRNIVFIRPEMDDSTKPSAHNCFKRYLSVKLALMRSFHDNNSPCSFYDREDDSIKLSEVEPLLELKNYGSIDYLIYDMCDDLSDDIVTTKLTQSDKTAILLATFHTSPAEFLESVAQYDKFLQPQHAEEYTLVKLLVKYVELEEDVTFSLRFRKSFLVTYLYYLHYGDSRVRSNIADDADESYLRFLANLKWIAGRYFLEKINQRRMDNFDITIVRNIVQMQTAIRAYEELNAFLGTTLPTLKMHKWFNSCFIYNYAGIVERENLRVPSIVDDQ